MAKFCSVVSQDAKEEAECKWQQDAANQIHLINW